MNAGALSQSGSALTAFRGGAAPLRGQPDSPFARFESSFMKRAPEEPEGARSVREAAEQLVSSAFLMPMLAEVRQSSLGAGPFVPNIVEKRFGPMLDQQIADRVISASRLSIVDAIVERLSAQDGRLIAARPFREGRAV